MVSVCVCVLFIWGTLMKPMVINIKAPHILNKLLAYMKVYVWGWRPANGASDSQKAYKPCNHPTPRVTALIM